MDGCPGYSVRGVAVKCKDAARLKGQQQSSTNII